MELLTSKFSEHQISLIQQAVSRLELAHGKKLEGKRYDFFIEELCKSGLSTEQIIIKINKAKYSTSYGSFQFSSLFDPETDKLIPQDLLELKVIDAVRNNFQMLNQVSLSYFGVPLMTGESAKRMRELILECESSKSQLEESRIMFNKAHENLKAAKQAMEKVGAMCDAMVSHCREELTKIFNDNNLESYREYFVKNLALELNARLTNFINKIK